jgi:hypothetical protein
MHLADIHNILEYDRWLLGEARRRYDKGMTHEDAADDLMDSLGKYADRRNPQGLYFTMHMIFSEFAVNLNDHVRKNYPRYLATGLRHSREFPLKHPALVSGA